MQLTSVSHTLPGPLSRPCRNCCASSKGSPSCLQATWASMSPQPRLLIVPHLFPRHSSTRPADIKSVWVSLNAPCSQPLSNHQNRLTIKFFLENLPGNEQVTPNSLSPSHLVAWLLFSMQVLRLACEQVSHDELDSLAGRDDVWPPEKWWNSGM